MSALDRVKSIRRITTFDDNGHPVTVFKGKNKKKKKQAAWLKPFEKRQRRAARAMIAGSESYLDRHQRSNRKKRNGWLRDLNKNSLKAWRKGAKKLKVFKL